MTIPVKTDSRRSFLKGVLSTAVFVGSGMLVPQAFASSSSAFAFRKGQPELLLHFNENSLGMSPSALSAAQEAIALYGNRYPDDAVDELRQQLSALHGIDSKQLVLGNGSTEVIGAVVELAASKNATVIEPSPTFGDVRRRAKARGLNVVEVAVGDDFITDIGSLREAAEKQTGHLLINICNPNNPTGSIVNQKALTDWIEEAGDDHLFLIDEAYFEYAQGNPAYGSALGLIQKGKENVIVTRTFSKIYGMAGMRIGYGFAATETAKSVDQYATSFNLSAAGVAAASASLKDEAFFAKSLASNQNGKLILTSALDKLNLAYVNSDTNFVLHRINSDLASYSDRMKQNGVRVGRRMTKPDGWNRISIGQPKEMEAFVQTLLQFRERGWV